MTIFITFIATFNLCVGYVLGVYIGVLPGVARRRKDELSDEAPIELAAAPVVERAPVPKPTVAETPEPAVEVPVKESSVPNEEAGEVEVKKMPAAPPRAASNSEPATEVPATATAVSQSESILAGLSSFRAQLAKVSQELRESDDDRESVDQCAGKLKEANESYLEKAHEVIDSFEQDEDASDDKDLSLKESLVQQTDSVEKANAQIDDILAEEDVSKAKEGLLASSESLSNSAKEFQAVIPATNGEADADAPAGAEVPLQATGLVGIECLNDTIDRLLAVAGASYPLQVASVVLDAELPDGTAIENTERLLEGLGQIVEMALDDGQMAAIDSQGHLLLLLTGDDEVAATGRCESTRQQVAAATFRSEGMNLKATVSCAVADSEKATDRSALLQLLDDALEEASRYGTNRTFHHDGKSPAPVVPATVKVEPLEIEV